ncbi:methyltransferase domain-containing protein [Candidatus Methylopumilus universalis]|uniref:Methyltransferase domain-containing protein n=1 Tax=Candidatus Methylopumilus universalis TaxID=2588536 RepID=A0ABX5VWK5_9PROT|nr:class I SAM-dependent methyltransferase [Candidatus Methylopumilus universalis]QDC51241.1 methyltransferase domain-containing protein [Candidatus Methylopumilus universalis]QDC61379.1 methyltransferase domain-containing protein [Candidatus Methylopumilus universalis]
MFLDKRLNYSGDKWFSLDGILQRQISAFLPSNSLGRILDYGAGNSPYRSFLSYKSYITLDITQNLTNSVDFIVNPEEKLPFDDSSFETVLLLDVLEHLPDPDRVLGEIVRVLSPGGRLFISVPFIYREHETPYDIARYTSFGIRNLINRHKGHIHRLDKVGNIYYTLLTLFLERGVSNGEINTLGLTGRVANFLIRQLVPLMVPLLRLPPSNQDGIYHHILIEVSFE